MYVKKALNRLDYYHPSPRHGITTIADADMIEALKAFQHANGLSPDGILTPQGKTIKALNDALRRLQADKSVQLIWYSPGDDESCDFCKRRSGTLVDRNEQDTPRCRGNCRCWVTRIEEEMRTKIYDPPVEAVYPDMWLLAQLKVMRSAYNLATRILRKNIQKVALSRSDFLTKHGKARLEQRRISEQEIKQAIEDAKKNGNVELKMGKYGTIQRHYHGQNNIVVIEETSGRNAGKIITSWRKGQ